MWKLAKPTLAEATADLPEILAARHTIVTQSALDDLEVLYGLYDTKGYVTDAELSAAVRAKLIESTISGAYDEFLGQGTLTHIYSAIKREIELCPMCSINAPDTLDHYMPHSQYPLMAVCRLNLVPSCPTCNRRKLNLNYIDFPHAYYSQYPNQEFLVANIHVDKLTHMFSWQFTFVNGVLSARLEQQVKYQWRTMMKERIDKAAVNYIINLLEGKLPRTSWGIRLFFKHKYEKMLNLRGRNDWRTALAKALYNCNDIKHTELVWFRKAHPRVKNDGI